MTHLRIRHISMAALCGCLLLLSACSDGPPMLRSQVAASIGPRADTDDPLAAQCQQLRDQIRANQESEREAPSTSTSPQIVAAAQGKADQRIDDLRNRMDTLGCEEESKDSSNHARVAPLPPAPNAPNP
jgi:hypothetical protein